MLDHFSFAWLRSPAQSIEDVFKISSQSTNIFDEGVFLSSSSLWEAIQRKDTRKKSNDKADMSLGKYWIRSAMRCVPYATFAGCAVIDIKDCPTDILLNEKAHRKKARLDMECLNTIVAKIKENIYLYEQIKFYNNNTIYELPQSYRYIYVRQVNERKKYVLSKFSKSDYVKEILKRGRNGISLIEARSLLMENFNAGLKDASEFLIEMIHSQILVPDIDINITGPSSLNQLIYKLSCVRGMERLTAQLTDISNALSDPNIGIHGYQSVTAKLHDLEFGLERINSLIQTDLFLSTDKSVLNSGLVKEITTQAGELLWIARSIQNREINNFKEKFISRFEDAEVELCIALDPELGIGYSTSQREVPEHSDILDDVFLNFTQRAPASNDDYLDDYVFRKYDEYLRSGQKYVTITDRDFV